MNRDKYEEAWTKLLAARRAGNLEQILDRCRDLCTETALLFMQQQESLDGPCSHFMVANGHCINCHEPAGRAFCKHTFDSRGVCNACGYNASQG